MRWILVALCAVLATAQSEVDCGQDGRAEGCLDGVTSAPTKAPTPVTATEVVTHDGDVPTPPPLPTPSPTVVPSAGDGDDLGNTAIQPIDDGEADSIAILVTACLILLGGCALLAFVLSRLRGDLQEIHRRRRRSSAPVNSGRGKVEGSTRRAEGAKSPRASAVAAAGGGGGHQYGALPPRSASSIRSQSDTSETMGGAAPPATAHYQDVSLAKASSSRTAYGETKLAPSYDSVSVKPTYDSVAPIVPAPKDAYGETSLWRESGAEPSSPTAGASSMELKR